MTPMKTSNILLITTIAGVLATVLAGCPAPDPRTSAQDTPAREDFAIPDQATAARVRGGDEIVYALPNEQEFVYSFYLAKPQRQRAAHQLIATVPADQFGFGPDEALPAPTTISFANNLEVAVIGFDQGSYLLERDTTATAQLVTGFRVTPIVVAGQPVFNPAVNPAGNRVAFETPSGFVGTGVVGVDPVVTDVEFLDRGVNPVFDTEQDDRVGFADPETNRFVVDDFGDETRSTFDLADTSITNFGAPFDTFEAGLTPGGIDRVGNFITTTRRTVTDPTPF